MKIVVIIGALSLIVYGLYTNVSPIVYECGQCGHKFKITFLTYFFSPHRSNKKYLKCPECGIRSWAITDDAKEKSLFRRLRW